MPCFPGHLGHRLPITATALSLPDTTAHNETSPCCARCSDTSETFFSINPSLPFYHLPYTVMSLPLTWWCECVCAAACGLLMDTREVRGLLGHHRWVRVDGGGECGVGGLPLSLWCVTSAAALSPTNGALVEPCRESRAEVLFESAWGQWGTAGSVWSTSADVGRMSTVSLTTDDHPQSIETVGIFFLSLYIFQDLTEHNVKKKGGGGESEVSNLIYYILHSLSLALQKSSIHETDTILISFLGAKYLLLLIQSQFSIDLNWKLTQFKNWVNSKSIFNWQFAVSWSKCV